MLSLAVVPVASRSIIYLRLDVHKDSITVAVLPAGAKAPSRLERRRGAMCEHARRRYAGRAGRTTGIPDPRMSQLPTHPLLAALLLNGSNRRISAGSTVDAASGPRRPTSHTTTCL